MTENEQFKIQLEVERLREKYSRFSNLSQYKIIMFALLKIDEREETLTDDGWKIFFNHDEVYQGYNKEEYQNWINALWRGGETDADGQEITWTYGMGIPKTVEIIPQNYLKNGEIYAILDEDLKFLLLKIHRRDKKQKASD